MYRLPVATCNVRQRTDYQWVLIDAEEHGVWDWIIFHAEKATLSSLADDTRIVLILVRISTLEK